MIPYKEQHISLLLILNIFSPEIMSDEQKARIENHNQYMKCPDADDALLAEIGHTQNPKGGLK